MIRILFWPFNKLLGLIAARMAKREYGKPE